jgi:murein DD-endopeptidase MepM/ murein hydrolase activator NlpD
MEVDPQFKKSAAPAARRRAARMRRRAAVAALIVLVVAGIGWTGRGWIGSWFTPGPVGDGDPALLADAGDQAVQMDLGDQGGRAIRVETPFVDIAGDPMILRFEAAGTARAQDLPGPPTLDAVRFGAVRPGRFVLVEDEMVVKERALMTALPSSREDFAFFQATQSLTFQAEALPETPDLPETETGTVAGEEVVVADGDASWGESLGGEPVTVSYTETAIQNTTSIAYVRAEGARQPIFKDIVLRVEAERSIADVLTSNDFPAAVATAFEASTAPLLPTLAAMPAGHIIAIRYRPSDTAPEVLNLSLYDLDGYLGSLSRIGPGQYGQGADAWIDDDLPRLASAQGAAEPLAVQDFRLLDGFYSAAIRNGVPTNLVGEAIVLMSKAFDMETIAAEGDRMTLLYAPEPADSGGGPGQILFAGIVGPSGEKACYVTASAADGGAYTCYRPDGGGGGGGGALGGGFVTPVQGTLTSKFGPRFHPILKVTKLHAGVDWAAPTGTPIVAVGDGTISFLGVAGGYGNVIYIDHPGGIQSRYAHMDAFGPGMANGKAVTKGELIGYVGTTGRSTGPHLHFEIHVAGSPVDPLNFNAPGGGGGSAPVATGGVASAAVETLTDVIIQVESGGNASARNPLSSATGLGQFIESTWLRMMRDYRPDLAANMSRQELLDLRLDPTLSREMVMNLARENESFLRGKGHQITAGRLYLAHFLGPSGADVALSAQDGQTVLAVMGQAVVSANPFLTNYTIADLKAWADRKMGSAPAAASVPAAAPIPPEVKVYMDVVDQILAEARGEGQGGAPETETGQPAEQASPANP